MIRARKLGRKDWKIASRWFRITAGPLREATPLEVISRARIWESILSERQKGAVENG